MLPWYAVGALGERDARRLEAALASDKDLAAHLAEVREELAATVEVNDALGAPSHRSVDALFARIDMEPARRASPVAQISAGLSDFLASLSPRTLAWGACAAALIICVQIAALGAAVAPHVEGGFQTASAPGSPTEQGALVLVRFTASARMGEVSAYLNANGASIVSGPAAGGFYRVRVANTPLPKDKLREVIAKFGKSALVDFIASTE
jgi:hypothetical protein